MLLKRLRSFITVLILLSFVGQVMAAVTVSCSMVDAEYQDRAQMADMDHSVHAMHDLPDTSSKIGVFSLDCCGDALCSMSHCIGSSTFGITTSSQFDLYGTRVLNTRYSLSYLTPESLSLFRPPITH